MLRGWRRFRPHVRRQAPPTASGELSARAHTVIDQAFSELGVRKRRVSVEQLDPIIDELRRRTEVVSADAAAALWFALLIVQAPRAVRAQVQMDKHPQGYKNKQARLFELIDFNDAYVSTVLALPERELPGFMELARHEMTVFCRRVRAAMFSDEQFEAITRGLSREIAVYLGAINQGYKATMTSRAQDAMGVDLVITEPISGRSLNIDCKTPSAYRYRIQELVEQGRMSEAEAEQADARGYVHEINGRGDEAVAVTIFRVDANELGEIQDFAFTDPQKLSTRLTEIFQAVPSL